jgi:hypothetical protein
MLISFLQPLKHHPEIASIDEGIQIAFSDEQRENVPLWRMETRDPASKVTVESRSQQEKQ